MTPPPPLPTPTSPLPPTGHRSKPNPRCRPLETSIPRSYRAVEALPAVLEAVLALRADAAVGLHGPPPQQHLEGRPVEPLQLAPGPGRKRPLAQRRQEQVRGEHAHLAPQLAGAHLQQLQHAATGGPHPAHDDGHEESGVEPCRVAAQTQLLAADVGAQRRSRRHGARFTSSDPFSNNDAESSGFESR